jgi:hypothetical protein
MFGHEIDVVVVDTSTPVPEIRTERVTGAEYIAMAADGDPDTAVAPQTVYVPLAADPVRNLQWQLDEIQVDDVWDDGITGDGITIGIVDTGVVGDDMNLVAATDFTGGAPGKFEHGNTVAAIAAATRDNGLGGSGVAPGASIVSAKVCADGSCASDDIARGILWVIGQGATVVNIRSAGRPARVAQVRSTPKVSWPRHNSLQHFLPSAATPPSTTSPPAGLPTSSPSRPRTRSGASPYWTSRRRTSRTRRIALVPTNGLFGSNRALLVLARRRRHVALMRGRADARRAPSRRSRAAVVVERR